MTDRARPGLVTFYDIRPGNGVGLFLQPRNPHGASDSVAFKISSKEMDRVLYSLMPGTRLSIDN